MDILYKKLLEIKEKPEKYIKYKSLDLLRYFISGYSSMRFEHDVTAYSLLYDYDRYLLDYYKISNYKWNYLHWSHIIILQCKFDAIAFDCFYDLSEKYLSEIDKIEREYIKINDYSIYKILSGIKKRPGMYTGTKNLIYLKMFLNGYVAAYNDIYNEKIVFLPGFQEFVQKHFELKFSRDWADTITFYCNDDKKAFDMFFKLLEEFWQDDKELLTFITE